MFRDLRVHGFGSGVPQKFDAKPQKSGTDADVAQAARVGSYIWIPTCAAFIRTKNPKVENDTGVVSF